MSHSSFKIIANDEPISHNLVILVNKNGSIGTDTVTLQNLLTSKDTPQTGVTVLRETSPTPSISEEIEEERIEQINMMRRQFKSEHPSADEDEIEEHLKKISGIVDVPHVTLSVDNFFPPDQARKFADDVLHLGGIVNPQMLMPIDFNFRRKIIENDHCYTNLTRAPEPREKKPTSKKAKETKGKREVKTKVRPHVSEVKEESSDSEMGEDDEECDEEQSAEEEEISFSESDDDNDMDFSVNDRFGKKGTKKKRKYRRQNHKSISFKDLMEGSADLNTTDDEPKKKYGKVSKKASIPSRPAANTSKVASAPSTSNKVQQSVVKKVQTQLKYSPIIRKEPQFTPSSTFKAATTTSSSVVVSQALQPVQPIFQPKIVIKKSTEKEIVESIAKDLEKSFSESNPSSPIKKPIESIPTIMQILETNTSAEVLDQNLATLEHIDTADGAASIEEINDALIAALGTEAIDELFKQGDLLNFDAAQNSSVVSLKPSLVPLLSDTLNSSSQMISDSCVVGTLSPSTPKILNRQAPQKDPIKIVKNGRVITLPPIEAPATRGAKRRAQGDPITPIATAAAAISVPVASTSPPVSAGIVKMSKIEKVMKESDSKNSSRRSSLNKSEGGKNSRRQSVAAHGEEEKEEDMNSDATWNSEDDPDRLWCICKQPHSNRFMICCDKCEDWFHGTCVSISKAQGKIMEEKNTKWLCPNCKTGGAIKKDPNKKPLNQQKMTKFFSKNLKESTDEDVPMTAMCVVCSKSPARTDSIYCSDECIQNQATKHLDEATTPKTPSTINSSGGLSQKTEGKRGNILKDQEGKVIVYDRITGKLLSSKVWPHMNNLSTWLSSHPNCEIVKPGSSQANQLMSSISNKKQHSASLQTPTISSTTPATLKIQTTGPVEDLFSNPIKINTGNNPTTPTTPLLSPTSDSKKSLNKSNMSVKTPTLAKPAKTASVSSSTPQAQSQSHKTPKPAEEKKIKRQFSDEKPPSSMSTSVRAKTELERQNVRHNFKSTLANRMKDFEHPTIAKMTDEEVEKFAKHLELAMFLYFNKDTKDKYKNKFRSLKFNLSDVKNKTLLEKICARTLSPQQLVTLPPSELASEELAKWRVDEEKHQLEIITKAELDALTQNKIIVKSRKGEEVIETKTTTADLLVPGSDEDLLSLDDAHGKYDLNKSISLNIIGHSVTSPLSSPSISSSTSRSRSKSDRRSRSRSKSRGRDHHHHKSSTSSKHKKKSRSRSPKHHHSSSHHSHSRDKSREKSREKSKHSGEHQEKLHRDKSKSKEKDKNSSSSSKPKESRNDTKKNSHHNTSKEKDKKREIQPEQEDVDLVGKILDSMGVHLEPKKVVKVEEKQPAEVTSTDLLPKEEALSLEPVNEHKLEIEIYSGSMFMAEVAKFDVTASIVSGNVDDIIKKLPTSMEIVGRIEQNIVWDYLDKVKKHGKELALLRFASNDESAYFTLFSYLNTRQRYGVIKSPCPTIKDFYLIPVEASRSLPSVLLPISGPGFIEGDDHKPDLLLGVILKMSHDYKHVKKPVKEIIKKSSKPSRPPPPVEHNVPIQILPTKHKLTHQSSSGTSSKLTMGLPEIRSEDMKKSSNSPLLQGDDEPYEPFDDDDEPLTHFNAPAASTSSVNSQATTTVKLNSSDDLESQVEFLSRQIEQRQMEIQKLAQQKAMELNEEQASRIYEQVSVPYNLSEMLSTIKASSENPSRPMEIDDDDDDDLEYVPIPSVASSQSNLEYRATTTSSYGAINPPTIVSSMMDIDERINLFRAQEMPASQPLPTTTTSEQQPSRLAQMSAEDLMKLVPDDAFEAPPAPIISSNSEPPIPGLD